MKRLLFALCVVLLVRPLPVLAQELVTDLTNHVVEITTEFHGAGLVLFGTAPGGGDVIVTVMGPSRDFVVRRKIRIAGIWLNRAGITFGDVPGYYAVFANRPLAQIAGEDVLALERIGIARTPLQPIDASSDDDVPAYRAALVDGLQRAGLYLPKLGPVSFLGGKLFRASLAFPSDIPEGVYSVQTYLVRDGAVITSDTTTLTVSKAGLPAEINGFAHDHGLSYGIFAVIASAMAGYLATLVFRKV